MTNKEKREFLEEIVKVGRGLREIFWWKTDPSESYLILATKLGIGLDAGEIISIENLEIRRRQVDLVYGGDYKKLIEALGTTRTIEKTNQGELIHLGTPNGKGSPLRFVKVKDGSSDREYILRVPNRMRTVRGAIAWTFGLRRDQYAPVKET